MKRSLRRAVCIGPAARPSQEQWIEVCKTAILLTGASTHLPDGLLHQRGIGVPPGLTVGTTTANWDQRGRGGMGLHRLLDEEPCREVLEVEGHSLAAMNDGSKEGLVRIWVDDLQRPADAGAVREYSVIGPQVWVFVRDAEQQVPHLVGEDITRHRKAIRRIVVVAVDDKAPRGIPLNRVFRRVITVLGGNPCPKSPPELERLSERYHQTSAFARSFGIDSVDLDDTIGGIAKQLIGLFQLGFELIELFRGAWCIHVDLELEREFGAIFGSNGSLATTEMPPPPTFAGRPSAMTASPAATNPKLSPPLNRRTKDIRPPATVEHTLRSCARPSQTLTKQLQHSMLPSWCRGVASRECSFH